MKVIKSREYSTTGHGIKKNRDNDTFRGYVKPCYSYIHIVYVKTHL